MKNILIDKKRLYNFALPHNLTLYAVECSNIIKDTVGGASNCVGLCGNSPYPDQYFFTSKSYHK